MSFDGERENHLIMDVRFLATNEEANDVWIKLSCTEEWREFDALDSQLRYGNWNLQPAPSDYEPIFALLMRITKRHTELRSICSQKVRSIARAKELTA